MLVKGFEDESVIKNPTVLVNVKERVITLKNQISCSANQHIKGSFYFKSPT